MKKAATSWHTRQEKNLIQRWGGKPNGGGGPDGSISGRPVEVRSIKKPGANRFRLMKTTHDELVKKNGWYIFKVRGQASTKVSARDVESILKEKKRKWYRDRKPAYRHTFLYTHDRPAGWWRRIKNSKRR